MKAALKSAHESQYTACEKLGVSQGCLNLWLNNKRNPSPDDIAKFCKVFNVTPNYLFGFEEISEQDKALLNAIKSVTANTQDAKQSQDNQIQKQLPEKAR